VVGSLAVEVLATGVALVVGGEVAAGWVDVDGALVVVAVDVLLPDDVPPKGSVYCWSPAEPPPPAAMVTAGIASARAPRTSMEITNQRGVRTGASMAIAVAARVRLAGLPGKRAFCRISCKTRRLVGAGDGAC
jgi:hypothetical protein